MVADVAVMEVVVEDEARTTLAPPIQRRRAFLPILEPNYWTMVRNLQQIKCETRGRNLCSMSVPIMDKTSAMNCKTRSKRENDSNRTAQHSESKKNPTYYPSGSSGSGDGCGCTNEIAHGEFTANIEVPVELIDSEKTQFSSEWRTYRERNANLANHKGQEFYLIQGQCTQLLQDKMKQYPDWITVSTSYDPLAL
jgi:hypothetical protein